MRGSVLIAVLAFGFASATFASDADILREAKDRAEIQDLMWRYARALGQFTSGQNVSKGREALRKIVIDVEKRRAEREAKGEGKSPAMHHVITNSNIVFVDKDHARHYSYWMTVFAAGGPSTPPRVAAAGRSIDELVRVNGKWLIKSRNVSPQD
jgi:hypothetical protein